MQVLYQIDVRGEQDAAAIREGLDEEFDSPATVESGHALALAAWARRGEADTLVAELAPKWPTHRQPPVDRAILRLAYYEIVSGHAPAKVAINEAIELAKQYGAEQSPSFVNGVLDKVARRLAQAPVADTPAEPPPTQPPKPASGDAWLDDAMDK
jgi:N utilization substance protein B